MTNEVLQILESKITLVKHLGIRFTEVSDTRIRLQVDLQKNLNHKGTAFGGSLYTTAVVAAYALILTGLRARGIATENIVIAKGSMEYFRPVESDFEILCEFPSSQDAEAFYQSIRNQGRGRREVKAHIMSSGGSLRAEFSGDFVVKL